MPRTRLATSEPRPSPLGARNTAMLTVSGQSVGTDLFPLTLLCPCVPFSFGAFLYPSTFLGPLPIPLSRTPSGEKRRDEGKCTCRRG